MLLLSVACSASPGAVARVAPPQVAGLQLWLDASSGVVGDPVSLWSDRSGNGRDFFSEGDGRPSRGQSINHRATVDFNGVNVVSTARTSAEFVSPSGWTVVAVFRYDGASLDAADVWTNPTVIGDLGGLWGMFATTLHVWGYSWSSGPTSAGVAASPGTPHFAYVRLDGAHLRAHVGGSEAVGEVASGELTENALPFTVAIGRGFPTATFFRGSLGDVAVWNRALTPEELGLMELYFTEKYGL